MESWQDILLILIFIINVLASYHAVRLYKSQSNRIDSLQKHIVDIKDANFGTIGEIVKPIKDYINLLEEIKNNESALIKEQGVFEILENIQRTSVINFKNIEILLNTRLTNAEIFSKATAYSDKDV